MSAPEGGGGGGMEFDSWRHQVLPLLLHPPTPSSPSPTYPSSYPVITLSHLPLLPRWESHLFIILSSHLLPPDPPASLRALQPHVGRLHRPLHVQVHLHPHLQHLHLHLHLQHLYLLLCTHSSAPAP